MWGQASFQSPAQQPNFCPNRASSICMSLSPQNLHVTPYRHVHNCFEMYNLYIATVKRSSSAIPLGIDSLTQTNHSEQFIHNTEHRFTAAFSRFTLRSISVITGKPPVIITSRVVTPYTNSVLSPKGGSVHDSKADLHQLVCAKRCCTPNVVTGNAFLYIIREVLCVHSRRWLADMPFAKGKKVAVSKRQSHIWFPHNSRRVR